MKKTLALSFLFFTFLNGSAQQNTRTVGFQFKPIFNSRYLNTGEIKEDTLGVSFSHLPKFGFCGGMVIRMGLTKRISLETGINYVRRDYEFSLSDSGLAEKKKFKTISYEIPVLGMVFIRLGEKLYMNTALGASLDIFPSNYNINSANYNNNILRDAWVSAALLANLGFEYRTEKSGYFYVGASYHRPFNSIYIAKIEYKRTTPFLSKEMSFSGNYLTLDLRYFFHEDPEKRKAKKRKQRGDTSN
jgi:hypothetical protein